MGRWQRTCAALAAFLWLVIWPAGVAASDNAPAPRWQIGAAWGSSSEGSTPLRAALTRPWKKRWFKGGRAELTGYWELSLARFDNSDVTPGIEDSGAGTLWNLALAPVWRLELFPGARLTPFLDLGVGLSLMSERNFRTGKPRSRPLGSLFQFEDRGAAGVRAGRWEIAYQRMHYSNLDLASENHGIDAHLLLLRVGLGKAARR